MNHYLDGKTFLRLSSTLTPTQAKEYAARLKAAIS